MKPKIKLNDLVLVLKGRDKNKRAKVLRVLPSLGRVVVEGVNLRKRRSKPRKAGEKGQVLLIPTSVPIGNVELICPRCSRGTRVAYRLNGEKKERVCRRCQSVI